MLRIKSLAIIGALALATAACGERPVDRALTGGAIGAGGGALVGAAAGNPCGWRSGRRRRRRGDRCGHGAASVLLLSHRPSGDRRRIVHVKPADVGDRAVA